MENNEELTIKDLQNTKRAFDRNRTPESKRQIKIKDGAGLWKLKLHEVHNYIEQNRKR